MDKQNWLAGWAPTPEWDMGFIEMIDNIIDACMTAKKTNYTKFTRRGYTIRIICSKDVEVEKIK